MQPSQDGVTFDAARQVDELCDRFEAQWLAGQRPRIVDYVSAAPAILRKALFQSLVPVELELLGKEGTRPVEADYVKRFPAQAKLISAIFKERIVAHAGPGVASVSGSGVKTASFSTPGTVPGPEQGLAMPAQIGRFTVLAVLGQGAFGRVYQAHDPKLDRNVALKVPKPGAFATAQERERFLREARAAAAIQHPNICPVHDVVLDGDAVYIVMAYVPGKSLAAYLTERKNSLSAKQAALIVRKLALALHAAHAKGVVHRDLKPANILFDSERKDVVITDFGLARRVLAGDSQLTQAGLIMGTPAYMSPEQARGESKDVGPAADIYSLGVILYELLTGTRPFQGSVGEIIGQVQHVAPEPPSQRKPGLDVRLEKICLKALAKSPKDRFGSMREFAYHLGEYLKDVPAGVIAEGKPALAAATHSPSEAAQMAEIVAALSIDRQADTLKIEQSHRALSKTIRTVGAGLALLLALGIGLVAFWFFSKPSGPAGPVVSVTLQSISHLHDNSVHYYLDGKKIDAKQLEGPLKLALGEHKLEGKRGNEVIDAPFRVKQEDDRKSIVAPLAEPEGEVGLVREMKYPRHVRTLTVSRDGRWILAAGYEVARNGTHYLGVLSMWEVETGKKLEDHPLDGVDKLLFGLNGNVYCALSNDNGNVPIILMEYSRTKLNRWEDLRRFKVGPGIAVSLDASREGNRLLLATSTKQVSIWNLDDAKTPVATLDGFHLGCLTPDGQQFFTAKGNDVILYDSKGANAEPIRTFQGHTSDVTAIACSPDGKILAAGTGGPANAIRTWEVATGKLLQNFKNHNHPVTNVDFSPDGIRLMTVSHEYLRISDIATGNELYQTPNQTGITNAVFSPGGRRAIFGLNDGTIKVWQLPK